MKIHYTCTCNELCARNMHRICPVHDSDKLSYRVKWYGRIEKVKIVKAIAPDTFLALFNNGSEHVIYSEAIVR